ncbi:cutinase-domain-containing protein [Melampsora americana]|nr:cutinase-domain-containing protein [Melampsora americana]
MLQCFNVMFFRFSICMMMLLEVFSYPSKDAELERRMMGGMGGMGNMMGGGGGMGGLAGLMGGGAGGDNSGGGGCKKYKIISARGTGENQQRPTGYARFISGVLAAVPDGGNYEVRYPATVDYMMGPVQGSADAMKYISGQQSSCPKQLYVLIGYSEGAMVVTQLAAKPALPTASVAAIVMYGNPYFKGGSPQNACSAKGGRGIAAATGISMPAKYSGVTFDCCVTGDMICQTAGSMIPHLTYGGSANEKAAVAFVVEKLKGSKPGSGGANNSTAAASGAADSGSGGGMGGLMGGLGGGGSGGGLSGLMGGLGGGGSGGGLSGLMGGLGGGGSGGGLSGLMGGSGGGGLANLMGGMGGGDSGGAGGMMKGLGGGGMGGGGLSALMGGGGGKKK